MKAFYYDFNYYLLPEQYETVADFISNNNLSKPITVEHLIEIDCMAPYFVLEEVKREELLIKNPQFIYPIEIYLLKRTEYDNSLRKCVDEYCQGCLNYGGDSNDLEGHHEEISLDKVCFLKRDENDFEFSYAVEYFWYHFGENKVEIEKLIDDGDITKAIELINNLIDFMIAPYINVTKYQGKYILMMSGLGNELVNVLTYYLTKCCNEDIKASWDIYSYLPKDIFQVEKKLDDEIKLYFEQIDVERPRFNLLVLLPGKKSTDIVTDCYLSLCSSIGENRLEAALNKLQFVSNKGRDLYNNEKVINLRKIKSELINPTQFSQIIDETYRDEMFHEIFNAPECFNVVFDIDAERIINERKDVIAISSVFPSMDVVMLTNRDEQYDDIEAMGITIGSLSFDLTLRNPEDTAEFKYIGKVFDEKFKSEHIVANFSMQIATNRFIITFLIMNRKLVRKAIRDLTPIFKSYNVVYSEIKKDKTTNYLVDYTLNEIK